MPCLYNYELDLGVVIKGNYTLEVQGTNQNNTSTHQKIEIQYNDRKIGSIGTDIIEIAQGKLLKKEEIHEEYVDETDRTNEKIQEEPAEGILIEEKQQEKNTNVTDNKNIDIVKEK